MNGTYLRKNDRHCDALTRKGKVPVTKPEGILWAQRGNLMTLYSVVWGLPRRCAPRNDGVYELI